MEYDQVGDKFYLYGKSSQYVFERKFLSNGAKSSHYSCNLSSMVLVNTVSDNLRRFTKREVSEARDARGFVERLGYISSADAIAIVNKGVLNCPITATAIRNSDAIFG